jgi:DNA invertase Pin-like site-specific DNA recombinase
MEISTAKTPTKRAALYVRVSTLDCGQTVENQLQPLEEAARRLGWNIIAIHSDEGISGAKGRDKRPGLDALLRGVTRGEYDVVASWSVCRLGRSLTDLLGLVNRLRKRNVKLYLHQQAIDSGTPSGRMLFGMLGVFSELERTMIRDRVLAGLDRARRDNKRLGRPPMSQIRIDRIRTALADGQGVRETARLLKVSAAKVSEIRRGIAGVEKPGLPSGACDDQAFWTEALRWSGQSRSRRKMAGARCRPLKSDGSRVASMG